MGRLIPAGTGMKYYRNVEIAYDPTQNRKEEDEFDEMADIRGGFDIPILANVPGVESGDVPELDEDLEGDEVAESLQIDDMDDDF